MSGIIITIDSDDEETQDLNKTNENLFKFKTALLMIKLIREKRNGINKEDLIGILILITLYTIQGIPMGFFGKTINMLLLEKGAEPADLGTLSLAFLPYSLKFLVAPFMDAHYFKFLGKRKTYIISMQYMFCGICFVLSYCLGVEIKALSVTKVFVLGIITITMMAIQDVAVDGWVISILTQDNRPYGSLAQTLGLTFGGIIASNLFIPLNSIEFCNSYIYLVSKEEPLLTVEGFWFWTGIITFFVTLCIHLFKKEKVSSSDEPTSAWEVVKTLKCFITNTSLRQLVLVIVTGYITIAPVYALSDLKLMQKGFPKEVLSNISTVLIPFQMLVSVMISKLCKKKIEMKIKLWSSIVAYLNAFLIYWTTARFEKEENYIQTLSLVIIGNIVATITFSGHFISNGSYNNRVCDESIGGTFLTTLAAISNLGYLCPESISLYISGFLDWKYMSLFTFFTTPLYLKWYKRQVEPLTNKTAEE